MGNKEKRNISSVRKNAEPSKVITKFDMRSLLGGFKSKPKTYTPNGSIPPT